jgi:hypothetical protein
MCHLGYQGTTLLADVCGIVYLFVYLFRDLWVQRHHETNIIIMRKDIHSMWDGHKFYLSLMDGHTDTKQELEFRWLRKGQSKGEILTFEPPNQDCEIDLQVRDSSLMHRST